MSKSGAAVLVDVPIPNPRGGPVDIIETWAVPLAQAGEFIKRRRGRNSRLLDTVRARRVSQPIRLRDLPDELASARSSKPRRRRTKKPGSGPGSEPEPELEDDDE